MSKCQLSRLTVTAPARRPIYVQLRSLVLARYLSATATCHQIDQTISHSRKEPPHFASLEATSHHALVVEP
jgi:hypothetical protein